MSIPVSPFVSSIVTIFIIIARYVAIPALLILLGILFYYFIYRRLKQIEERLRLLEDKIGKKS
jgi:chromate transport protein ChrA